MKLELLVSEAASLDLEQMHAWLTQPGAGIKAAARLDAILDTMESLADKPQL